LIQVLTFLTNSEPDYLPLLVRGLLDLTILRFSSAQIDVEVNPDLEIVNWPEKLTQPVAAERPEIETLWLNGELEMTEEDSFQSVLLLYDPKTDQVVYRDGFQANSRVFLSEWENHLQKLICFLKEAKDPAIVPEVKSPLYTNSLEAFLAFRKGLETLLQAKNQRQRESGLEFLLEAITYDPEFWEAADILLLFLIQNGVSKNFVESLRILEKLRRVVDNHPRIPLVTAELYFQWGNFEKAEQILNEVVERFPGFTEGPLRKALFLHSRGRFDEALAVLRGILELEPENSTVLDLIGAVYAGLEKHDLAEKAWQKALKVDPKRVNVLNNLGILAEEKGSLLKAENYFQQAIKLNENWWGSYFNYGSFCYRQNRLEEAVFLLDRAGILNSGNVQTFLLLGKTHIKLGQYAEAEEAIVHLLQVAPDNIVRRQGLQLLSQLDRAEVRVELRIRKLEKLWESGKHWLVIGELCKAYKKAGKLWFYWFLWGCVLDDLRLKKIAILAWRVGLNYQPGYPLLKKVGLYYTVRGDLRKALPFLRKAFKFHKSDPEVTTAYFQTLINLGEIKEYQSNVRKFAQYESNFGLFSGEDTDGNLLSLEAKG